MIGQTTHSDNNNDAFGAANPPTESERPELGFGSMPTTTDPLLAWATKGSVRRLWLVALTVLLISLSPWILASIEHVALNNSLRPDLFRDFGYWGMIVLSPPLIILAVGFYLRQLPKTIRQLTESDTVEMDETCFSAFKSSYGDIITAKWVVALAFAVGLSAVPITYILIIGKISGSWHFQLGQDRVSATFLVSLFPTCLSYYIFASSILHIVSVSRIIRRLFSHRVNIQPLHPDQCGGLYPLGKMCTRMNLVVFAIGLVCIIGILNNLYVLGIPLLSPNTFLIMFAYILSAMIVFFLPLLPAHGAMTKAKRDIAFDIHKHFQGIHRNLNEQLSKGADLDKEMIEDLGRLRELYNFAQSMPVYPFNAAIVRSFSVTIITPVFLGVVTQIILDVIT